MKIRLLLSTLSVAAVCISAASQDKIPLHYMPSTLTITTADSSIIFADLYRPMDTTVAKFPLVVLIHSYGRNGKEFNDLIPLLMARKWAVLNVDLRGHGRSNFVRREIRVPDKLRAADFRMMVGDLFLMLKEIEKKSARIDATQLGIIGASIGSSIGIIYGAKHPEVKAMVLLSPGLEYKKLNTEPYLAEYGRRPVLFMVGKYDTYPYLSSRTLDSAAFGEKQLIIYENAKHGTDQFEAVPGADSTIVEWLDKYL